MSSMIVKKKIMQPDRILLWKDDSDYYVIANLKEEMEIGDEIEYEPYGYNFGWFERVNEKGKENKNE